MSKPESNNNVVAFYPLLSIIVAVTLFIGLLFEAKSFYSSDKSTKKEISQSEYHHLYVNRAILNESAIYGPIIDDGFISEYELFILEESVSLYSSAMVPMRDGFDYRELLYSDWVEENIKESNAVKLAESNVQAVDKEIENIIYAIEKRKANELESASERLFKKLPKPELSEAEKRIEKLNEELEISKLELEILRANLEHESLKNQLLEKRLESERIEMHHEMLKIKFEKSMESERGEGYFEE